MSGPFVFLIPLSLAAVLVALGVGLFALFRGGDFGRSWSNRMMRIRVLTQFIAIVILVAAVWWKTRH
ncbi:MAG: twin transmembrane helix small protein [Alphaproteobacteria bacterium]